MADEKGPDEKILCVPLKDPAWMRVSDVHDIPAELRNEIEHFFQVYKDLEEAKVETRGYGNRAEAEAARRARARPRMIVFGAIAPHGDPAFVERSPTRLAFEELGRRFASAKPDVTIVVTPHNVHVEGAFAVITAASLSGSLSTSRSSSWAARSTGSSPLACSRRCARRACRRSA